MCRRRRALAAAALAAASLACSGRGRDHLTVAMPPLASNGLVVIAEREGLFAAEGVDVDLRIAPTGRDALALMHGGGADLASAYETPVVLQAFRGAPMRILTTLHTSTRGTAVVARADRGVRTAADLRGKRVGVPRGTNAEFCLRMLATSAGLRWSDLAVRDVAVADAVGALASGRVDAVAIWSPLLERAARAVGPEAVTLYADTYLETSMLVTREAVLRSRRPALEAALRGLARAERLVAEDPARAFAAVQAALGGDGEEARERWGRVRVHLGVSNALLALLRSEGEWLAGESGEPRPLPDFRALLVPDLLDAVDPESVTLEGAR